MFDFPIKTTDSKLGESLKRQAEDFINEYNDYNIRLIRYNYINSVIKFIEQSDSLAALDDNIPKNYTSLCLFYLEDHVKRLLNNTPITPIYLKGDKYWNKDNTHIYCDDIIRIQIANTYEYFNNNAYNIRITKIIDYVHDEIFSANDIQRQEMLQIIKKDKLSNTYIEDCQITSYDNFAQPIRIPLPIIIPCVKIIYKKEDTEYTIYAVEEDEPMLKELTKWYRVSFQHDYSFNSNIDLSKIAGIFGH